MTCKLCGKDFIKNHFNQALCSLYCKKISRALVLKKHKATDKWQASNKRWQSSEKFKSNEKIYRQKPLAKKKAIVRSTKSLKGSPEPQEKKRLRDREFAKTEKGRALNRLARKKYNQTDKCKIVRKNAKAKRRTLEKSGKISLEQWSEILAKNNHQCVKCKTDKRIEMDHIIPLSKGGAHSVENIQPLCRSCNASKGNKIWQN